MIVGKLAKAFVYHCDCCVNASWTVGLPVQERNGPTTAPTFFGTSRWPSPTTTTTTTATHRRYVNHYRAVFGYGRGGDKPWSVIVACCVTILFCGNTVFLFFTFARSLCNKVAAHHTIRPHVASRRQHWGPRTPYDENRLTTRSKLSISVRGRHAAASKKLQAVRAVRTSDVRRPAAVVSGRRQRRRRHRQTAAVRGRRQVRRWRRRRRRKRRGRRQFGRPGRRFLHTAGTDGRAVATIHVRRLGVPGGRPAALHERDHPVEIDKKP